ncbi:MULTISPECIES: phage tail protein [unclassified Sedimentibacter]|uniref:phage tail protein n=1 Tax=unclassified Sedimentibacter TaxID=2649220 RepID=UPI0027DFADC7|nr:phage tail protein [Sedimentibacter sp. MB35-C1]WMJ78485.1 phage tail protein [Sedimentibacter sp. MB35-C1]
MEIQKYIEVKSADKTVAFLSPSSDGLKEAYIDARLNGESALEFSLPSSNEKNEYITSECEVYTGGKVYNLLLEDAIDEVMDESGSLWTKYMAVERWNQLNGEFIEPYINNTYDSADPASLSVKVIAEGTNLSNNLYTTGSAAHALYAVLQGSDWSMGICDVTGIHNLEAEKVSRLQLIKQIQEIWGGYLVWDSVNKIAHLRDGKQWQNYTGFQIRYAKNMKNITRTQSNKIVTKLYCFGKDNLDISSVNDGKMYVADYSYTSREYSAVYSNPDIENAEELKQKGIAELALNCRPKYYYQTKMVDLRTLPEYSHEEFALGDMADILNSKMNIADTARIIRHKYNVFQPWQCEFELGEPNERFSKKLKASFNATSVINKTFNSVGEISGKKLVDGSVIANAIADSALDASKFNTKQLILTGDEWSNNTPSGGRVSWNSHKLFYEGTEYTMSSGNTNKKYIVWQKDISATSYRTYTQTEFDGVTLKDYDWVIAVNNSGLHDIAWYNRMARQFIASAFIADAAIKTAHIGLAQIIDAHIANLSANKLIAGIINTTGAIYLGDTSFALVAEDKQLIIKDTQAMPKTRVVLGYNGNDYGIWIYNKNGKEILGASGLGVNVVDTNQVVDGAITDAKIESLSADKIKAGIIEVVIEMLSPIIRGGDIYGSKFYGPYENSAYAKIGTGSGGNLGDFTLYRGGDHPSMAFQIYDDATNITLKAIGDNPFLKTTGDVTYPQRKWDFSEANTTGIVARIAP